MDVRANEFSHSRRQPQERTALEFHDRVRTTMKHEHVSVRAGCDRLLQRRVRQDGAHLPISPIAWNPTFHAGLEAGLDRYPCTGWSRRSPHWKNSAWLERVLGNSG